MLFALKTTAPPWLLLALLWAPLTGCVHRPPPAPAATPRVPTSPAIPPLPTTAPVVPVDYAAQVRPILERYCYQCHGNGRGKAGVRLDVRTNALQHLTPGNPKHSDIYRAVTRSLGASDRMPPVSEPQPTVADLATLKLWIEQGAAWPPAAAAR